MEEFNLNKHTVEEIPGKYLYINGVKYIFRDKIKEGENARIYLLQHAQSGYSHFVAKVLKLDNQSDLYRTISQNKIDNSFRLNLEANFTIALHTEIYEVNGTLLKFQEYLSGLPAAETEAYQPTLMNEAIQHNRNKKFQKAIEIYTQVLAQNPYHTDALINMAGPYINLGEVSEAIEALLRAIKTDKNYRISYFQLAKLYQHVNNHELAIQALEMSLDRWAYDSEVLTEIINLCLDYDLMDYAVMKITFIHNYLGLSVEEYLSENPELKEKVIASQFRIRDYNQLLTDAYLMQANYQYKEAEPILAEAFLLSKNNVVAEFNYYLCKFHLGETTITSALLEIYSKINDPTRQTYCLLLCLLIAIESKNYPFALNLVEIMVRMLKNGPINKYDLPRIPYHYYQYYALENPDFMPILSKLMMLQKAVGNQESVDLLIDNYQQLSKEWAPAG